MNEELVEAMEEPSDTAPCDPTSAQDEEISIEECPPIDTTKRGDPNENLFEKAVEDPVLSETADQDSDLDRRIDPAQEESTELERMRCEIIHLQVEIANREMRLEQISKEFEEFNTLYPHTPLSSLQDSVWADVRRGIPIAAAYALAQRRAEHTARAAAVCNQQNASRSSGALQGTQSDYFSPAEVRAMSQSEVRANYQKIMQSMQKWH